MIEVVVFDNAVGPEIPHEVVLANKVTVPFHQKTKGVKEFWTKRDAFTRAKQTALRGVEFKRAKYKNH